MRIAPSEQEADGPNLTPVIDIVFLLLIFFLVATRFDQQEREISTKLVEVMQAQPLSMPPNEIIVNVSAQGEYIVVDQTLDQAGLESLLHTSAVKNPGQKVQIRADEDARFKYPAYVMGLCEREQIEHYVTVVQAKQ